MAATETCPNCGESDAWLKERARFIQYGCNLCDHTCKEEKES